MSERAKLGKAYDEMRDRLNLTAYIIAERVTSGGAPSAESVRRYRRERAACERLWSAWVEADR